MSGRGLDAIPVRWPAKYDPVFMERWSRDVLAKADIRNAAEGLGISITSTLDDVATVSASEDFQQLFDADFALAEANALLPNARTIAGEVGVVSVTDGGAGGALTIGIPANGLELGKLAQISPLSVLGNDSASPADVFRIASSADDTILRRVAGELNWGQLTVGMAPDDLWTYAKIQNVSATNRIMGRITAGAGDMEELTAANVATIIAGIAQNWTGSHAFTGSTPATGVASSYASLGAPSGYAQARFCSAAAPANQRILAFYVDAADGSMHFNRVNDAENAVRDLFYASMSGFSVTGMQYGNSTDNPPHTFYGSATGRSLVVSTSNNAGVALFNSSAGENAKWSQIYSTATTLTFGFVDDALASLREVLAATRSSQAVTGVAYGNSTDNPPHTFNGVLIATTATTARASVRLPHGAAPSSPVNGDMWTTTAGLYVRINGVTVGPLS